MAVDDVEVGRHPRHHQVLLQRVEQLAVARVLRGDRHRRLDAVDDQVWRAVGLVAEGEHADEVPALSSAASSRVRYSTCTPAPPYT